MRNRIREFRQRSNLTMQALAERAGTSAAQINKLEKGERRLTVDWMVRLGRALEIDPKDLLPPEISAGVVRGAGGDERSGGGLGLHGAGADLPVVGRALDGSGALSIPAEQQAVDWTYRPPQLRGVADAFAIYAYDDVMHPMYKHGQMLWVHPHLPVKPGDGVLVVKHSDEAIIRELVRRSDTETVLRQYRPVESETTVPATDIRRVYRIVGSLDLR